MDPITVSAPGKLILFGEHAAVYGKMAISCSVGNRTFVRLTPTENGTVNIVISIFDINEKWSLESLQDLLQQFKEDELNEKPTPAVLKKLKYFLNIKSDNMTKKEQPLVLFLYLYLGICKDKGLPSAKFQYASDLPISSGLGSSASVCVCLAAILLQHQGLISSATGGDSNANWSNEELEMINTWSFRGECIMHGNPSGIDNTICTFGGVIAYEKGKIEHLNNLQLNGLIVNSKVERSTKKMVEKVASKIEQYPNILNPVMESIHGISQKAKKVLESDLGMEATCTALEELIDLNHFQLCALGVSHRSIDQIHELLLMFSLHSKLTGAGGGGCIFALLNPNKWDDHAKRVIEELTDFGFEVYESALGGSGVRLCNPDDMNPF